MVTVIAAVISAAAAIIVSVINNNSNNKKIIMELEKYNTLHSYQISELDKKVEKHNKVIERVYNLERQDAIEFEQIKNIKDTLEELKKEK